MADTTETVRLVQQKDGQFTMRFDGSAPDWQAQELPALCQGTGPSPVQLLAAAAIPMTVQLRDVDGTVVK